MSALTLGPVGRDELFRVHHLRVAPGQEQFSGQVADAFEAGEPGVDFHGIFEAGHAVGFFKIDTGYGQNYPFAGETGLGLRAFLIDHAVQGRGFATTSVRLMPHYIGAAYPTASDLFFTVNLKNPAAIAAYRKGGFIETGEVWAHGSAGPQNVMRLSLER